MAKHFLTAVALSAFLCPLQPAAEEVRLFSVGAGDISGNYFSVARTICDTFNNSDETRRRCSPEPTAGSIYNLTMLGNGELDFALVQSDWLKAAYEGSKPFAGIPPMTDLRAVALLYPESVTILAAPGSGIRSAADLAGRTVDIGRPASGRNATFRALIERLGLEDGFFGNLRYLEPSDAVEDLCSGKIDASVFVVGHPSQLVAQALNACDATIASFAGPMIQEELGRSDDFQRSTIDLEMYGRSGETVKTVSVMATLVTRESIEAQLVSDLVEAIRSDTARGISLPVLGTLDEYFDKPADMVVPLHVGLVPEE